MPRAVRLEKTMEISVRIRLLVVAAAVWVLPVGGHTHPGGTDEEGCHTCESNCEEWGQQRGDRHCHGGGEADGDSEDGETDASKNSPDGEQSERAGDLEENQRAYVQKVLDGDTLVVRPLGGETRELRVRILGIDCPESHKNPKCRREGNEEGESCAEQIPDGLRAARRVSELIDGTVVRLESGAKAGDFDTGGYGRVLAYIRMEDGRDLGKLLIGEDHCRDYGTKYPHPRHEEYERAQAES